MNVSDKRARPAAPVQWLHSRPVNHTTMPAPTPVIPAMPATRLIAPRLSLASCVRTYIARNTVDTPLHDPAQRLNRFPASALCSLTFFIEGCAEVVEPAALASGPLAPALFVGPQTRPAVSYNPGAVRAFMVIFYPQAIQALSGIDLIACVDGWFPLADVLDPEWDAMAQAVLGAPDDAARVAIVEQFLDPRWQQLRAHDSSQPGAVGDWVRRLAAQAAAAGWGHGVRNVERRIKAWAGQPMRTLRRMHRAEQSFLDARDGIEEGKVSWADVAARGGYSDQAHFCREAREITGHSPTELARVSRDDESYWVYRVWS
ncbi:helix-turn-helix domain-containing protein [Undibacterium sp.]|uniref:helix-turn-helix domain-containing protein n=1 Tax=Undibacterium sp. TaxID=1914977 RepID=UPI002CA9EA6C|nr:helix-turn-helix domain-containing protein [Undibacterium sp.]HTD04447.1 helix-turn-helix domain-containing protein [Undibacterium sp.]